MSESQGFFYFICTVHFLSFSSPLNRTDKPTVGPLILKSLTKIYQKNILLVLRKFIFFVLVLLGEEANFCLAFLDVGLGGRKIYQLHANFLSPLVAGRRDMALLNPNKPIVIGTCSLDT